MFPPFTHYLENNCGLAAEMFTPKEDIGVDFGTNNLCFLCFKVNNLCSLLSLFREQFRGCPILQINLKPRMGESLNNLKIQFPNFKIWNIIKQIFFMRIM